MSKYLSFEGSASRSEYWGVTLPSFIAFVIAASISGALFATGEMSGIIIGGVFLLTAIIFYCWVFLSVTIKRCREAGISPWWTASCFLPYVGWISWIVIGCISPSQHVKAN